MSDRKQTNARREADPSVNIGVPSQTYAEIQEHAEGRTLRFMARWAWETFKLAPAETREKAKKLIVSA